MSEKFTSIFQKASAPEARAKYLSRIFGIFSEEIVRVWASDPHSPYQDIGRPTLKKVGESKGATLDFTFLHKESGQLLVVEQKCEIEYQNFKYLVLNDLKQLDHNKKDAFLALLDAAAKRPNRLVFVNKKEVKIDGAILIWGAVTTEGRKRVMDAKGFFDILTIEEIINDLQIWNSGPYRSLLEHRHLWANEMFEALLG